MRQGNAEERGFVLVLVLIIVTGMAFLGFDAMRMTRVDMASSVTLRTNVQAAGLLEAGFTLARVLLLQDTNEDDGPYDTWNYFPAKSEELSRNFTIGTITGVIEDENSRFAINSLVRGTDRNPEGPYGFFLRLVRILVKNHSLSGDPVVFADEVLNWIGPPSKEKLRDLDSKYQAQRIPIRVPHRYMRSVEELLLIQWPGSRPGAVETLYYGTDKIPGLRDLVSVHARGPMNMNTAHRLLLYALPMDDNERRREGFVERALEYRNNPLNSLSWKWYEATASQVNLENVAFLEELCGIDSTTFRFSVTAITGLDRHHAVAILERRPNEVTRAQIAL